MDEKAINDMEWLNLERGKKQGGFRTVPRIRPIYFEERRNIGFGNLDVKLGVRMRKK